MTPDAPSARPEPPTWAFALAFAAVYLAWGTTYLAIRVGVAAFPPFLFGGLRVTAAGAVLLVYLLCRREPLRLSGRDLATVALTGCLFFLGGNGLVTLGEKWVESGVASVLVATTPLWIVLVEWCWPQGDRLTPRGWAGILLGLAGVLLLYVPRLREATGSVADVGALLILGSAFCWALGSVVSRYRRPGGSLVASAALQMITGGLSQTVLGLSLGEAERLTPEVITEHPAAVYAFFHLLVVGSLIGFLAYNWLLSHVSAPAAGTYAYVNPVVAVLAGWLLVREPITPWVVGGMTVILAGVALVRSGGVRKGER